ncbi:hypothetical protein Ga0466249_004546 [Sporomusaceae bacterium BoRhaA]|nr:hypothetical protein [Pelorhabdus rhamnosifermentans]
MKQKATVYNLIEALNGEIVFLHRGRKKEWRKDGQELYCRRGRSAL